MLDFDEKTYQKIFDFCAKNGAQINFFEYPFFSFDAEITSAAEIIPRLKKNFKAPNFSMGLYIHVPFCQSRCLFCRYYSEEVDSSDNIINEYLDALERQLGTYGHDIDFSKVNLRNLYLGGGTPTLLNETQLSRLFRIIRRFFDFDARKIQISCEATPQSVTRSKIRLLRSFGVNRVSLGIQSFNNRILESVERKHTTQDIIRSFEILREAGIRYLSTDFLIGLPGETLKTYQKTIDGLLRLEPEFIEGFIFTPDYRMKLSRGRIIKASADDIMRKFVDDLSVKYRIYFKANSLSLVKKGISVRRANNQNLEWMIGLGRSCLGLGPSGINVFSNIKFTAESNVKNYINHFKYNDGRDFLKVHYLTPDDRKRHFIITHIAVSRWFYKKTYRRRFGSSFERDFPEEVSHLKKTGVLAESRNKFIWHFDESEMGHRNYFLHALKYWYHPKYIRRFLKKVGERKGRFHA